MVSTKESSSQSRPARWRSGSSRPRSTRTPTTNSSDRRGGDAGEERQAERRAHEVHGVGAEHEELAVGEVDHAEDAEDQRQADAHQRVHRAAHQTLEDQLGQDRRVGEQAEVHHSHSRMMSSSRSANSLLRPVVAVLAEIEHVDVIGDLDRLLDVLVDHQDGEFLLLQLRDLVVDEIDQLGHQADRGLVEQQRLRSGHGQARDLEHALLAARERARRSGAGAP